MDERGGIFEPTADLPINLGHRAIAGASLRELRVAP
jgi:hypothetical protein